MTRILPKFVGGALALSLMVWAGSLHAQARNDQLAAAQRAYDEFDPARARDLLRVWLNPAAGPTDSVWARGVQLLVQTYVEEKKDSLAALWARWAVRLAPDMKVDTVTFLPEAVRAIRTARTSVLSRIGPGDADARTDWDTPAGSRDTAGAVRLGPSTPATGVRVLVVGVGLIGSGQSISLAPGTYDVQATADGFAQARVSREVLPGVTTVLRFNLRSTAPVAVAPPPVIDSLMADDARSRVNRQVARLTIQRFGLDPACAAGAFVSGDGLLVTTYVAIRGADAIEADLSDGTHVRDGITIASYDTRRNIAVLKFASARNDSLVARADGNDGQFAWEFGYPGCQGLTNTRTRVVRFDRAAGVVQLADSQSFGGQGGPVVDRTGTVLGFGNGGRSALSAATATDLVAQARRSVQARQLTSVKDAGRKENHLFGSVAIRSAAPAARIRVKPLETWQWAQLAQEGAAPLTFTGPMGRYQVELLVNGQVRQQATTTISAGNRSQLSIDPPVVAQAPATPQPAKPAAAPGGQVAAAPKKGKSPMPFIILGGVGAGGLVALLAASGGGGGGGGGGGPPGPTTGSVSVHIPVNP